MKLTKIIIANIIMTIAALPALMVFHKGPEIYFNIIGMLYCIYMYKYGKELAPAVVNEYLEYMTHKMKSKDATLD